ncbi:MAG: TraX family protein [Clostridia bacterium]|nr:TraX family protein [Clostridia bacterium]
MKLKTTEINRDVLKVIAMITMLIDHIGYYFADNINTNIYYICRIIGRISMPLFLYMLVQGFFYTKNLKRYIIRVFSLALITQLLIYIVSLFDVRKSSLTVVTNLNVLFSFSLLLIVFWLLHEKNIFKNLSENWKLAIKILLLFSIIVIYVFIPIDYGYNGLILGVMLYFIERLKIMIYINRNNGVMSMKGLLFSFISEKNIKYTYILAITLSMIYIIVNNGTTLSWYMLLSIMPIYLYSGEKGRKRKWTNIIYYCFFPTHHIILYIASIMILLK